MGHEEKTKSGTVVTLVIIKEVIGKFQEIFCSTKSSEIFHSLAYYLDSITVFFPLHVPERRQTYRNRRK